MSKWDMVKLSDMFTLQMGKTPSRDNPDYWNGNRKWVSISDLGKNSKYIYNTKECITDIAVSETGIKITPKDTVIMSFKLSIGKTAITVEDIYTNEAIMSFIDNGIYKFDLDYIYYLFNGKDWNEGTNKAVMGITLNKATLSQIKIPLPPLEIQKQIAENLDKVTRTIDLCHTILEKLDLLVKARFVEMFGDIYTNDRNFPICTLSDYIVFITSGSRGWAKYCVDDGKEWFVTIKNVKDCRISTNNMQPVNAPDNMEAKRTKVEEGDLLISITADLGRTGVVTREIAEHGAYINQHLTCVRLDQSKLVPLFVAYFMESDSGKPQFESKNQTGVKAGLNFDSIKSLKLLIPPLALQKQFTNFVEQNDISKSAVKQVLEKAEALKKALMQEYFG